MKKCYFTLLLLFTCSLCLNAQGIRYGSRVTLKGQVIDAKTQRPIPFANIGFVGKGIGTVSDEYGNYALEFPPAKLESIDRLQFSVVGYKPQLFSKNEILRSIQKPLKINLVPEQYQLDELVLGKSKRRTSNIGDLDYDERIVGYWKEIEGLGGEILTKVKVRRKNTKLHNLKFKVLENGSDSLLVRVNVYDLDRGLVGRNLLQESIQYTLDAKSGLVSIPLEKYNVVVHENIIVGIELLKVYGKQIGFSVAGSRTKGISFVRYRSQDNYEIEQDISMAFELEVSTPDKRKNFIEKRDAPENIILYWDASTYPSRAIDTEIKILKTYLDEIRRANVQVVKFAAGYLETNSFNISKGKSKILLEYLLQTNYGGVPIFENLPKLKVEKKTVAFLVTSGNTILSDLRPNFQIPTFVITSNIKANVEALEDVALYSDGAFILANKITVKDALKRLTYFIDDDVIKTYPKTINKVVGRVSHDQKPIERAEVSVKGSYDIAFTDKNGVFSIEANTGDTLTVSFLGLKSKTWVVTDKEKNDISLKNNSDILTTTTITGKKRVKPKKVEGPDGNRDPDAIGYRYSTISEEDIRPNATTLGDVLQATVGLEVRRDFFNPSIEFFVFPRTFNQPPYKPPVIVIDGLVYTQERGINNIPPIDPQNIKSINISSSLIATNIYGGIANGGVIKITMKSTQNNNSENSLPNSLVSNKIYRESIPVYKDEVKDFGLILKNAPTALQSKELFFKKYLELGTPDLNFFMESFKFYKNRDPQFSLRCITTLASLAPKNIKTLNTLAFALEDLQEHQLLMRLRTILYNLTPNNIQSYRNLAVSYVKNKKYPEAFEIYKTILANNIEGLDFNPLQETAENELRRLLAFHKSKVSYQDLPEDFLAQKFKKDYRLVFEWNDPALEFELQFVNPDNKYFTWDHTLYNNQERILSDLTNGLMIKEFEIENFPEGRWLVNLKNKNGDSQKIASAYLKYTLYTDYATPNEKEHTKIISLENLDEKITIDQITLNTTDYEN